MSHFKYTAAERKTIDAAYDAAAYICDHIGHAEPYMFRGATRYERRERSSMTVARALIVAGFADGRRRDPRASAVACLSDGIATATILGAKSRRLRPARGHYIAKVCREFPRLAAAAAAAHDAYLRRGVAGARAELSTPAAGA